MSKKQHSKNKESLKRNHKKGRTGLKRVLNATKYSRDGFISAWREEEGFRQVSVLFVLSLGFGLWLSDGFSQKILLCLSGVLCVIVELFNTAIENAIDHTSLKPHPFAKKAKDMGSAAQLLSLLFFALVWGLFLWERFIA